jgi:hypothetical protein
MNRDIISTVCTLSACAIAKDPAQAAPVETAPRPEATVELQTSVAMTPPETPIIPIIVQPEAVSTPPASLTPEVPGLTPPQAAIMPAAQPESLAMPPTTLTTGHPVPVNVEPAIAPQVNPIPAPITTATPAAPATPKIFTTGISVAVDRRVYERVPGTLVRGYEDGEQAVNFKTWLVPFDSVLKALQLRTTTLSDGQVELRSATHVVRLDLKTLTIDPDLGLVLSIQQLEDQFGITATFDFRNYAIALQIPNAPRANGGFAPDAKPVLVEGLPQIAPPDFTPSLVEQRIQSTGTTLNQFRSQGTLRTVGSVFGGSWYAEVGQRNVSDPSTWQLSSLQYLRQTPQRDLFIGSQPTFWQSQSPGDFWGITTIGRQGYAPQSILGRAGGANPTVRLQSAAVTGTLNGYAEPGTLARLVRGGEGGLIVAEQVVDATGRYQFNQVAIGRDRESGTHYSILLYPRGQITATPRVETPRLTILPEQLPKGASSNIVSAGWRRSRSNTNWFGEFTDFNAGVAQRWGLSESLTVGVGSIYDDASVQGLGELFFQPKGTPFRFAATGRFGEKTTVRADAVWDDYPRLYAQASYIDTKMFYSLDVPLVRSALRFLVNGNSDQGTAWGLQYSGSLAKGSTYARLTLQPNQNLSWELFQNWRRFNFSHRKNDFGTTNYASYQVNPWNAVVLEYNTRDNTRFDQLATLSWHARSKNYQIDGSSMWTADLGYGVGSRGSGPYAALSTSVIPGLNLQARYQGVSLSSNTGEFSVALVSSFGTQSGLYAGNRRVDELRTQGGILVQPFYDRNSNGKRDQNEEIYTESSDFMILNNELVNAQRVEKHRDRFLVRLLPGLYRLDLEAAGFPPEFQPTETALSVRIQEGSYTPILIPLQPSYTASGIISRDGQPVNGARVEAVNTESQQTQLTTTNTAGVYYLEPLRRGTYRVMINGKPAQPELIQITESTKSFEEINFVAP